MRKIIPLLLLIIFVSSCRKIETDGNGSSPVTGPGITDVTNPPPEPEPEPEPASFEEVVFEFLPECNKEKAYLNFQDCGNAEEIAIYKDGVLLDTISQCNEVALSDYGINYGSYEIKACPIIDGQEATGSDCSVLDFVMEAPPVLALNAACSIENNQVVLNPTCTNSSGSSNNGIVSISGDYTGQVSCNDSVTVPMQGLSSSYSFEYVSTYNDTCEVKVEDQCSVAQNFPAAAVLAPEKGCDAGDAKLKLTSCEVGKQYQVTINGSAQIHTCTGNDEFSLGGYGNHSVEVCAYLNGQSGNCVSDTYNMPAPTQYALTASCGEINDNNQMAVNFNCTAGSANGTALPNTLTVSGDVTDSFACNGSMVKNYTVPSGQTDLSLNFNYGANSTDGCVVKPSQLACNKTASLPPAAVLAPEKGCDAGDAKLKLTSCEVGKQYKVTINGATQLHTCTGNDEFSLGGYGNHSVEVCSYLNGQSGNCVSDTYNMPAPTQYALTASCGEINDNNQMVVNFNCTAGSANGTTLSNTLTVSGDATDSFACNGSMVKNYTLPAGQTDLSLNFNYGANSTDGCVVKPSQLACNKTASLPPAAVLAPEKGCDAGDAKLKLTSCEVGKQYQVTINGATQLHTCTGNDEFSLGGYGNHSVEVCSYLNGQSGNCVSDTYNMPAPTQYAMTASCGEIDDNNQMAVNFNCTAGSANGTTLSNTLTVSGDATDSFACNGAVVKNYTVPAGQTDLSLNFNYGASSNDGCVVKPSQLACNKTASLPPAAVLAPEKGCDAGDAKLKLTSCEVGKQYKITINGSAQIHTCTGNDEFSLGGYGNHSVEVCAYLNGQNGNCVSDTYNMPAPTQYAMTATCGEINDNNQMAVNFNCTAGSANGATLSNTLTVSGDATDSFACNGSMVKNYTVPSGQTDLSLNFNYGANSSDGCVVKPSQLACNKNIDLPAVAVLAPEKGCDAGNAKLKLTSCEVGKQYRVTINGVAQMHTCTGNDEFSLGGYGNHSVEVCSYLNGQSGNCVSDTYNMPAPTQYAMTATCGEINEKNQMAVNFNCTAGSANGTTLSNTLTVSGDATDSFACNGAVTKNYAVPSGQTDLSLNFNYGTDSTDGCVVKPEEISCSKEITIIPPIVEEEFCGENYLEFSCSGTSKFTITGCVMNPMEVGCRNGKIKINLDHLSPGNHTCYKQVGPLFFTQNSNNYKVPYSVEIKERSASCDEGCEQGPITYEPTRFACISSGSNDPVLVLPSTNMHAFISTSAGSGWQPIPISSTHSDWINPNHTLKFDFSNTTCSTAKRYIAVCSDRVGPIDRNLAAWLISQSDRYESGLTYSCPDGTGLLAIYKVDSNGSTTNIAQGGMIVYSGYENGGKSNCAQQGFYVSPLMLNYLGDGVDLSNNIVEKDGSDNRLLFDIDADGKKEYISCPKNKGTVFVVKPNEDGEVINAHQLFGDKTKIDGHMFANGFDALAYYDTNNDADEGIADGVFNSKDPEYSNLRLWEELNCNGIVDEGELYTLEEKGVHEIVVQKDGLVESVLAGSENDVDQQYRGYREYMCDYGNGRIDYCMDNYNNQSRLKSVYRTKNSDGSLKTNQIFDIFFFDPSPLN